MTTIVQLIAEEANAKHSRLMATAVLAGLLNVGALILVNAVAHAPESASATNFLAFAIVAGASIVAARISGHRTVALIETALQRIVARIVGKIERTELQRLERIGAAEILDRVTDNVSVVSIASSSIGAILPSLCILAVGGLYLLATSPAAFAFLLPLQLVSVYLYRSRNALATRLLKEEGQARVRLLGMLTDLLRGAKEIRLGRARTDDVLRDFKSNSKDLGRINAKTNQLFDDNTLFVTTNLYVVLAALVFVMPKHVPIDSTRLSTLIATILFLWGSVQAGLGVYLYYVQSNDALANIDALEKRLEGALKQSDSEARRSDPWQGRLGPIEFVNVEYTYAADGGDTQFHVGPIDITIEPGEVLFIVGGNGSGKSTLLKVLTGLYTPTRGSLRVGDVVVDARNAEHYREMISVIFADFHLFSKAYGLLDVDPETVRVLLREMQIEHKTSFEEGAFTQQRLSTGQKKRLAMVLALLEDRPLFVLDEWAADQDPEFRKYFYENIIPALKRRGKTVIAVSHDDRYFPCADRVLTMEYGQVRSLVSTRTSVGGDHPTEIISGLEGAT
ncbi:MAG TPA: ATP-binding cassette domain-containing protein [Polyangium sp.]|nr:ATP-binding cassette domain-containing protein [Polyangium sp.]